MAEIVREEAGFYTGHDFLLAAPSRMTLRPDGNLDVHIATFPFPTNFVMTREALDDPAALDGEIPE